MPPRFAYWTILIDGAPTAFRARDRGDLLGISRQLGRRNSNVEVKWFSNGRLWNSPEEAREATKSSRERREPRGPDWRPGGKHEDPRARYARRDRPDRGPNRPKDRTDRDRTRPPDPNQRTTEAGPPDRRPDRRPPRDRRRQDRDRPGERPGSGRDARPGQARPQPGGGRFRADVARKPRGDRPPNRWQDQRSGQTGPGRGRDRVLSGAGRDRKHGSDRPAPRGRDTSGGRDTRGGREPARTPGTTSTEREVPAPPQPPGPERPPKPGQEPTPDTPPPETIKILPEPPERAAGKKSSEGPAGTRLVRKRRG